MTKQLSSQGAQWALAAIALSAMASVPSRVCGLPQEGSFYLKSSPWACAIDVLITVVFTARSAKRYSFVGLKDALYETARAKFDIDNQPVSKMRTSIRFVLFVFGALPQAVKLFASHGQGLVHTQLRAACYLISFVFDEALFQLARRSTGRAQVKKKPEEGDDNDNDNSYDPLVQRISDSYVSVVLMANISAISALYMQIFNPGAGPLKTLCWLADTSFFVTLSTALSYFTPALILISPSINVWLTNLKSQSPVKFWTLISVGVHTVTTWSFNYFTNSIARRCGQVVRRDNFAVATFAVVSLVWISLCWAWDWKRRWADVAFLLVNVAVMAQYYNFEYDATKTYKPDWVEWLG